MANQTRTYPEITRQGFDQLRAELVAHGITPPEGDTGTFPAPHGFTISWVYTEATQVLVVTIDGSVFFIGMAWAAVESGVGGGKPATAVV